MAEQQIYKPHNPGLMGCLQLLLLSINLMYMVGGALLIIASVMAEMGFEQCLQDQTAAVDKSVNFISLRNTCFFVGGLVFITGTVGCVAAWKENYYLSLVYCFFIGFLFILTSAAVSTLIGVHILQTTYRNLDTLLRFTIKAKGSEMFIFDIFQAKFECCGVNGYEDWFGHPRTEPLGPKVVPPSCCKNMTWDLSLKSLEKICYMKPNITFGKEEKACGIGMETLDIAKKKIYTEGCVRVVNDIIMKHILQLEVAVGLLALLEMLGLLYACCFMRETKRKDYERYLTERKYKRLLHDNDVLIN